MKRFDDAMLLYADDSCLDIRSFNQYGTIHPSVTDTDTSVGCRRCSVQAQRTTMAEDGVVCGAVRCYSDKIYRFALEGPVAFG